MAVLCPRCKLFEYTPYAAGPRDPSDPPPPALSRVAEIDICTPCGLDEALRDVSRLPPIPPNEWPVAELPTF
jgi:hypothetical protein